MSETLTKADLEQALTPISQMLSKLQEALAALATKAELNEAVAPLATKAEALQDAVAPLATKAEALQDAVAPLATKVEALQDAVAPLAARLDAIETELADKPGRAEFTALLEKVHRVIGAVPLRKEWTKLQADVKTLTDLVLNIQEQVAARKEVHKDVARHELRIHRLEGQVKRCPDINKAE